MALNSKKGKREKRGLDKVLVKDVYLLKTEITSSYSDENGNGPMWTYWYFLATKKNDKYYDLFVGDEIETNESCNKDGYTISCFDKPYIVEVKPMTEHLVDKKVLEVSYSMLYKFVTNMNVLNKLGALDAKDESIE